MSHFAEQNVQQLPVLIFSRETCEKDSKTEPQLAKQAAQIRATLYYQCHIIKLPQYQQFNHCCVIIQLTYTLLPIYGYINEIRLRYCQRFPLQASSDKCILLPFFFFYCSKEYMR